MTSKTPIAILGAGGDAFVIAETVRQAAQARQAITLVGFLDDRLAGQSVDGLPVFGTLEEWQSLDIAVRFIPAIHKLKRMHRRMIRLRALGIPEERWISVVHPTAVIARSARISAGVYLAANVVVQPRSTIGTWASIRAGASIGHDAICADGSYMGPNSTLCGRAVLEEGAHLGPNAVVIDGVTIGPYSIVGAGTVATKRVPAFELQFGVPARRVGIIPKCT